MVPQHMPNLPWREVDGRVVVLSPRAGTIHELNPVASFLWRHADGKTSSAEIARKLSEAFDVESVTAVGDATQFFSELEKLALIRQEPLP